jgi:hypothetical protein
MVVIYLRANRSVRRICRISILPIDIHEAGPPSVSKHLVRPKTHFEVNGAAFSLVALPAQNIAESEIASILSSRAICQSIGIAWLTAFCTSGMVIAEADWAIVNVKLVSGEAWKGLYPGTGILSVHSTIRMTCTKFFWTAPKDEHKYDELKGEVGYTYSCRSRESVMRSLWAR